MGRTVLRALLIGVVGAALGLLANAVLPRRIPYITPPKVEPLASEFVSLDEAKQQWGSGQVFFLDARAPADYRAGHIAGAFSLPTEDFEAHFPQVSPMLTPDTKIVAYCDGMECDLSHHLKDHLEHLGYTNIHLLQNGWTVWHGAGYPASKGDQP